MHRFRLLLLALIASPAIFSQPFTGPSQPFSLSIDKQTVFIWGSGQVRPRVFFPEFLSANFSRTLSLDHELPADVTLHWLFTGPHGSLTIDIANRSLTVAQQYYDSFGLETGDAPPPRYPHATGKESSVVVEQAVNSVEVSLHDLTASVSVNGHLLVKQSCAFDLMRHQLSVTAPDTSTGSIQGKMSAPATGRVTISIDSAKTFQTILGFGGSVSIPGYDELSPAGKDRWWQFLKDYNLLIQREYPVGTHLTPAMDNFDRLADASPHYYGDNFPDGEMSDFAYNKHIRSLGGHIIFEFWELPMWAKQADGKTPDVDKYVQAVLAYCKQSAAKTGAPPDIIGIQNEIIQPGPVWEQMIVKLRKALDDAGFQSVKLHMPDASYARVGITSAETLKQTPEAWNLLDYSATHVYDFQAHMTDPDSYLPIVRQWAQTVGDKPFIATELTLNNSNYQMDSYGAAFAMGQLYYQLMAVANAKSLNYCWMLLDTEQPSFNFSRSLFTVDRTHSFLPRSSGFELRIFGAFSRRLREGMVRLDVHSSDPDLQALAFRADSGAKTFIFLNRSTAPKEIALPAAETIRSVEHASLSSENAADSAPQHPLVVAPGEILTVTTTPQ